MTLYLPYLYTSIKYIYLFREFHAQFFLLLIQFPLSVAFIIRSNFSQIFISDIAFGQI